MPNTLDQFTEATTIEDGDLFHLKRGTGTNTDQKVSSQVLKAAMQSSQPGTVYGSVLLSGSVTWISGLSYDISPLSYIIDGTAYSSAADTVTLSAAHATLDRIDVLYADTSGLVGVVAGTASANPAKPELDRSTQLELTFVSVPATATTPENTGATLLYGENVGDTAEWDATESTAGARIDVADTADPYAGTVDIAFAAAANGDTLTLTSGSAGTLLSLGDMDALETHIKVTTWGNKQLQVAFFYGVTRVSSWVNIANGTFGFDSSSTAAYQTVNIPKSAFNFTGALADSMQFVVAKGGGTITAKLDQVRIQTGGSITVINVSQGLTESDLINQVRTWNVQQAFGNGTLTDGATITWDLDADPIATITLGGNRTLNFINARAGGTYLLRVIQDGTGSRTLTWNAGILWPDATDPTLTTTASGEDVFSFAAFDSTNLYGFTGGQAFG